jgi:hypothetical protein
MNAEVMQRFRDQRSLDREAIALLCQAVAEDDGPAFVQVLSLIGDHFVFPRAFRALVRQNIGGSAGLREQFLDMYIECGDHIRQEVNDDLLLADVLRLLLPSYQGPGLKLFRGDSFYNRRRRTYGLSWSDDIEVAKSFAETGFYRLFEGGSVLLVVDAKPDAIISAPAICNNRYGEREFLVDRRRLTQVAVLARYGQLTHEEFRARHRELDAE